MSSLQRLASRDADTSGSVPTEFLFTFDAKLRDLGISTGQRTSNGGSDLLPREGTPSRKDATMTLFRNPIRSALSKTLLAGLVVAAIFSTPLQAREHSASDRHAEESVRSSVPRFERDRPIVAPSHNAFAPAPSEQPDGVCDHGDNPMVC